MFAGNHPPPPEPHRAQEEKNSEEYYLTSGACNSQRRNACSTNERVAAAEESGRERLRRHRVEMGGRVRVPDMWGQENRLKDWVDNSVFDRFLVPQGLATAREALVEACRRRTSSSPPDQESMQMESCTHRLNSLFEENFNISSL